VDLCVSHSIQEYATPKRATQGGGDLEERATGSFFDETGASQRIRRRMTDDHEKPRREEPQSRKA
jgi:hypothetical protein